MHWHATEVSIAQALSVRFTDFTQRSVTVIVTLVKLLIQLFIVQFAVCVDFIVMVLFVDQLKLPNTGQRWSIAFGLLVMVWGLWVPLAAACTACCKLLISL